MSAYYQAGGYTARIVDQGLSQAKTGNPQIFLKILILECKDDPSLCVQQYDRTIFWTLTEKTIDFVLEKLQRLGFSGDSFGQLSLDHPASQSFIGDEVDAYCKIETDDEGRSRERWDVSQYGSFVAAPLGDEGTRKLDALFGRKLKETSKAVKATQSRDEQPPPAEEPQGVPTSQTKAAMAAYEDSEIPF